METAAITNAALAGGAVLVLLNGLLSLWLGLGLERKLLVASVRTVLQLLVLGYVLVPVFELGHPLPVVGVGVVMVGLAANASVGRSARRYRGIGRDAFFALTAGALTTAVFGTAALVGVEPWWTPRYLLPLLGMVLGNSLSGVSLGLDRSLRELDDGRARVELLLSRGASPWEAARPVAVEALRTAMIPILNTMMVAGLVTIPGMMTGQLLAGAEPALAARYQILIMFLIVAATGVGSTVSVLLSIRAVFDRSERLRPERLQRR